MVLFLAHNLISFLAQDKIWDWRLDHWSHSECSTLPILSASSLLFSLALFMNSYVCSSLAGVEIEGAALLYWVTRVRIWTLSLVIQISQGQVDLEIKSKMAPIETVKGTSRFTKPTVSFVEAVIKKINVRRHEWKRTHDKGICLFKCERTRAPLCWGWHGCTSLG